MSAFQDDVVDSARGRIASSPRLLVSVRDAAEAHAAIAGGAEVIDVKEPSAGSLGRASSVAMQAVADVVGQTPSIPCSVALGELSDVLVERQEIVIPSAVRWVKLGLSGCAGQPEWSQRWFDWRATFETSAAWIAVAYVDADRAEAPSVNDVLTAAIDTGCAGLLLDTYCKTSGTLLDCMAIPQLRAMTQQARSAGLMIAFAGRVQLDDLPTLIELQPDLIAVRSAVCRDQNRSASIDAAMVAEFRQAMHAASIATR